MESKDIPKTLKEKQERQRKETIEKVQSAINLIREEGGIVSKKKLIEITKLAATTFSKQHVKEVLKKNKVCQYEESKVIKKKEESKLERLTNKNLKLQEQLDILTKKLSEKEIDYDILDQKYQKLLWKLHELEKDKDIKSSDHIVDLDRYR